MERKRRRRVAVPLLVFLLCITAFPNRAEGVGVGRELRQSDAGEVEVTTENVAELAELVNDAERDAVFVFTEDVRLPQAISVLTNRVVFRGAADARPTLRCADGEGGFRVGSNNVRFENLVFRGCSDSAIYIGVTAPVCDDPFNADGCPPEPDPRPLAIVIENVDFLNNDAGDGNRRGGGFSAAELAEATLRRCRFERNNGPNGGAIAFGGTELNIEDCTFRDNQARFTGGAIFALHQSTETTDQTELQTTSININGSTFEANSCETGRRDAGGLTLSRLINLENNRYLNFPLPSASGGAVYVSGFSNIEITESSFYQNVAVPAGGAIYLSDNENVVIEDCEFEGNYVVPAATSMDAKDMQLGGAIFAAFAEESSRLAITSTVFENNSAVYGGAVHFVAHVESQFETERCRFENNRAELGGGAMVFRNAADPTLSNTRFVNNRAFVGGAIFLTNGGGLRIRQGLADSDRHACRFENNVAFDGGALFGIGGGTLQINRAVIRRNRAERNGGGVCLFDSKAGSEFIILDARMYENAAERGGAVYLDSISSILMFVTSPDRTAEVLGFDQTVVGEFINNTAVAGGAVFYRASNLVDNTFVVTDSVFEGNAAAGSLEEIFPEPLDYPRAEIDDASRRRLLQEDIEEDIEEADFLISPSSAAPCEPGGGGAMCLVLSGISARAPASVELTRCNFTENRANAAGAVLLSTENSIEWRDNCPQSEESTSTLLTSQPCRSLSLRALRFEQNSARFAGGALLATNLTHVHYSTVDDDGAQFDFQTLDTVQDEERFVRNTVGQGGYGPNIASTAVGLAFRSPAVTPDNRMLADDHQGGPLHSLPLIEVQVVDAMGQVVSDGITDSALRVRADSKIPGNESTIAGGQVVATAKNGVASFEALTLTAPPGEYEVIFSVRRQTVADTRGNAVLRECRLGERFSGTGFFTCEACVMESFTVFVNATKCEDCPNNARCAGNASLVPVTGYWHSSPFSVIMHECFHSDACSYNKRQQRLEKAHQTQAEAFLQRFDMEDSPEYTNEEYPQCAEGYEGPLCGSCADGYGHADGKTCIECSSKSATAAVIFLLAVWQLIFLAITIRSALVSIRDMNQMYHIAQQQQQAANAAGRTGASRTLSLPAPSHFMVPQTSHVSRATTVRPLTGDWTAPEIEAQYLQTLNAAQTPQSAAPPPLQPPASVQQQQKQQQYSADYIIAAQHVSETIKIFVNFFQITSVAVNINLDWTTTIKNMLGGMNSVAGFSNGATFTPMTCLLDADSDDRSIHGVILRIAFPLFLMVLVMLVFVAQWFVTRRNPNVTRQDSRKNLRARMIICFLVVGFFAYQSISEDLMGTVSCIELDSDELSKAEAYDDVVNGINYSNFSIARDHYWTEDTSIECFSRNHAYLVGFLGIPGIVLFLCGIPLYLLIFLLYKRHMGGLMDLDVINTYGFIYQNYEDKFVYWEVCILVRKALISAIVVFAYPLGANLQGVMALGVLILALAIHLIAVPFKYLPLNVLEGCSLVVSIFTFYAGVVFNDENTSESAEVLLSVLLLIINSLLVVVILLTVFVYGDKYVYAKLLFMGVTDIPGNPVSRMLLLAYMLQERVKAVVYSTVHRTMRRSGAQQHRTRRRGHVMQMTSPPNTGPAHGRKPDSDPNRDASRVIDMEADDGNNNL